MILRKSCHKLRNLEDVLVLTVMAKFNNFHLKCVMKFPKIEVARRQIQRPCHINLIGVQSLERNPPIHFHITSKFSTNLYVKDP